MFPVLSLCEDCKKKQLRDGFKQNLKRHCNLLNFYRAIRTKQKLKKYETMHKMAVIPKSMHYLLKPLN